MKLIYVAHPIGGNVKYNLEHLAKVIRYLNLQYSEYRFYATYYADCVALDDSVYSERKRGIDNDIALINTGVFDEIWLTGDKISHGMQEEVKLFTLLGKEVIDLTNKINV